MPAQQALSPAKAFPLKTDFQLKHLDDSSSEHGDIENYVAALRCP